MAMIHSSDTAALRRPVLLRLAPERSLAVRVTEQGASGSPVAGALVTVQDSNSALEGAFDWGRAHSSSYRPVSLYTDDQGWARFTGLSLGEGMVLAEKEGFARGRHFWGGDEQALTIAVVAEEAVVEGRVLHANGRPIERATVTLCWANTLPYDYENPDHDRLLTDIMPEDQGRFRIGLLPPGAYELKVSKGTDGIWTNEYADEFQLETAEHLRVTYPDDSASHNPRRWLYVPTEDPGDIALRQKLIGAWYQDQYWEDTSSRRIVWDFREDGHFDRWVFSPEHDWTYADGTHTWQGATSWQSRGLFRVENGSVRVAWKQPQGFRNYTRVEFPGIDRLILLKSWQSPDEPPYIRTNQLDRLLREGEWMSGPLPTAADRANEPLPRSGTSSFGRAGI